LTVPLTTAFVHNGVVMLTRYRRHRSDCPHAKKGRRHTRCSCPIWTDGMAGGRRINHSLKTSDWGIAGKRVVALEDPDSITEKAVEEAVEEFMSNRRGLAPSSKRKYGAIFGLFVEFCESIHRPTLSLLEVRDIDRYLLSRNITPLTASKELQTLRTFCEFCVRRRWMRRNLARDVDMPVGAKPREVRPYASDEIAQILKACDEFGFQEYERRRARTMVLLMRYAGLRISDVMTLGRDRVQDAVIHLHTEKNSGLVRLPLPLAVVEALRALPIPRGATSGCPYYFWNGNTSRRQLVTMGHKTLSAVFARSQVRDARSHRFRHTLATDILAKGGTMQDVADVLGISSAIAERHYAKWSLAREERIFRLMQAVHGQIYEGEQSAVSGVIQ
jgi:integrase